MKTTIAILIGLAITVILWLKVGSLALLLAPLIALFVLLTFAPMLLESMEAEIDVPAEAGHAALASGS